MDKQFENKMVELANVINIEITKEQCEKFYNYMNLLLEWNEKINLTAITEKDDIILKHFIDSLTINKQITKDCKIVDVGTGAGFPGIPLAIINPEVSITLLDSLNKRILFLDEVIGKLGLKNVETIHSRVEDFGKNRKYREQFDVAVSRAVANMASLSEYLIPLVKVGGICICMKGAQIEDELREAKYAIEELGGKVELVENFKLADTDNERNIVVIKKIKQTQSKYPRKAGTPAKMPLKKIIHN